jgi:DNA-binding transcriptional MerR regulator
MPVDTRHASRLFSIGEFSAATQLSPKALRLYNEQGLLQPASIDAATGYRYYGIDQVPLGRWIRTLRDMDLPLSAVADIVSADRQRAEALIIRFAQEADQRFARQKRAFQNALAQLNRAHATDTEAIEAGKRGAAMVVVRPFIANRWTLLQQFRVEVCAGRSLLEKMDLDAHGEPSCVLVDPLSDEDSRLEVLLPIAMPSAMPAGVTVRQLPAATCATYVVTSADGQVPDLTAALDALFDWFDRRGSHITEPPTVSFGDDGGPLSIRICWTYEPVTA